MIIEIQLKDKEQWEELSKATHPERIIPVTKIIKNLFIKVLYHWSNFLEII